MNTTEKGDKFEEISCQVIEETIINLELGILPDSAKVYRKKKYYSRDREKDIIFDLSIEIWPKNAERYSFLYLIECKSSSNRGVPVDDVEEFYTKFKQVSDTNVKGIMITDKSFQQGGFNYARNKGIMLIEVHGDSREIILHREKKNPIKSEGETLDLIIRKYLINALNPKSISGLKRLTSENIEKLAKEINIEINGRLNVIQKNELLEYMKSKYNLKIDFNFETKDNTKIILGCFSVKDNTISINKKELQENQLGFVLGHELGHFFLHSQLTINQEMYDNFEDTEYSFFEDKHLLLNDKHWIEWQANRFAISLFLPSDLFKEVFVTLRKSLNIRIPNRIYLDNQAVNQKDYNLSVNNLSQIFGISKTSIRYRIEELGLITHAESRNDIQSVVRRYFL